MDSLKTILKHNLPDYENSYNSFSWEKSFIELNGLPNEKGINIAHECVDRHADSYRATHVALRCLSKDGAINDYTYAELKEQSNRFANMLRSLGIEKGDKIFALSRRVPQLYFAIMGTFKNLSVFCPMFPDFGPEPIFQRMYKGEGKILVTSELLYLQKIVQIKDRLPCLKYILITDIDEDITPNVLSLSKLMAQASSTFEIPQTNENDVALLHFTSGTTGMPKGALHVHKAILMHYITGKFVLDFHPEDIFWCTADPGWVTGTSYGIIAPLVNGITNIIDESEFDALRWYSILEQQKVSIWYTSPTAIRRLMRMNIKPGEKYHLEHLRLILSVGEPLDAKAVLWGKETFGFPILDNWWQTETGGIMIANYPSMTVKPGSMGKPLPGIEAAIAEISGTDFKLISESNKQGHLVLKKGWPSQFVAYINENERYNKCFRDEWYLTGDLAKKDEDGYYWFIGRADDIIKTSGHMVGPFEVESLLIQHPAVAEVAVIGKPEPMIGELVKAFIILKPNLEATENLKLDIIAFARKKSGTALAPKEISFVDTLPKTKSGKILRRLLKAREMNLPEGDTSTLESM